MVFNFIGSKCKKNRTRKQVKCDNNNSNNKILKGKKMHNAHNHFLAS